MVLFCEEILVPVLTGTNLMFSYIKCYNKGIRMSFLIEPKIATVGKLCWNKAGIR